METKAKRPYNKRVPMTPTVELAPGQKWVSRDPRDASRVVTVMACEPADKAPSYITLESDTGRRSQIRRERFYANYSYDASKS